MEECDECDDVAGFPGGRLGEQKVIGCQICTSDRIRCLEEEEERKGVGLTFLARLYM